MTKDPWFKFYPADWISDIKLQSCSLTARGLLIELMCLIHQSEKPGYLLIGGNKPSITQGKNLVKTHHKTYISALKELLKNGVLQEDEDGIYCPRMVRDHAFREQQREYGKRGGNPKLLDHTLKGRHIPRVRSQKSESETDKEEGTIVPLSSRVISCPVDDVVELYHKTLPTLPKVRTKGKTLKSRLGQRWKEYPDLDWWAEYFRFVAESRFLTGKKTDWCANLFWLTGPENLEKVLNNTYHRDQNGLGKHTAQNLDTLRNWKEKADG